MSFSNMFKSSMLEIVEETKKGNADFADDLLDILFGCLDEELEVRSNSALLSNALNDISGHLHLVYSKFQKQAQQIFGEIKHDFLRETLGIYYANQLQAIENDKLPLACKSLFQQIESLLNYLMSAKGCLNEIRADNKLMIKFKVSENTQGYVNFSLKNKLFIASSYYLAEFQNVIQNSTSLAQYYYRIQNEFDVCYELRHIDSHGILFDQSEQGNTESIALGKFKSNSKHYISTLDTFIKNLAKTCILVEQQVLIGKAASFTHNSNT